MKLICAADIHLGRVSSLPEDLSDRQDEFTSEKTLGRIIEYAINEDADAILVAGDIFDKSIYPFVSKKIFEHSIKPLVNKNIDLIIIPGNHDLKLLEQVVSNIKINPNFDFLKIIGCGCKWESIDYKGLQIIGFGFDKDVYKDNPFDKLKSKILTNEKYLLMLHGDYTSNEGKYAPFRESLSSEFVQNSIITLIGHTHKFEEKEKYVSLGSPQALDFGEKGQHGIYVIDINEKLNIEKREFVQLSNIYYDNISIEIKEKDELSTLLYGLEKKLDDLTYYRLNLEGRVSKEKYNSLEEEWNDIFESNGYINDKIYIDVNNSLNNTLPDYDIDAMCEQKNAVGVIAQMIKSIDNGTFTKIYENEYKKFKEESYNFLNKIQDNELEEKEIIDYIKQSLIKFLKNENKKSGK